jgi:hypothetical protein
MESGKTAGDDQGMARKDAGGFTLDPAFTTGHKIKDVEEGTSQEVGNPQKIDINSPSNK